MSTNGDNGLPGMSVRGQEIVESHKTKLRHVCQRRSHFLLQRNVSDAQDIIGEHTLAVVSTGGRIRVGRVGTWDSLICKADSNSRPSAASSFSSSCAKSLGNGVGTFASSSCSSIVAAVVEDDGEKGFSLMRVAMMAMESRGTYVVEVSPQLLDGPVAPALEKYFFNGRSFN